MASATLSQTGGLGIRVGEMMGALHQMGHDSENLLFENQLQSLSGVILSPVNYDQAKTLAQVLKIREERPGYEIIFDPQLYVPDSTRGHLPAWSYFPKDIDTADRASLTWWKKTVTGLVKTARAVAPNAICSPIELPNTFPNSFYTHSVQIGDELANKLAGVNIRPVQTVLANLPDLALDSKALEIASLVSKTAAKDIYLLFVDNLHPRRERIASLELEGAMGLIDALEGADLRVTVGFSSTDLVLWKAAGASSIATGKFFNLRRFTRSRFEEAKEGGQQIPYWFEQAVMAFIRDADLERLKRIKITSDASDLNPFCQQILDYRREHPGKAWIALSWRQYLYWAADCEMRIDLGLDDVDELLKNAEATWQKIEDARIFMEEARNDGTWVRPWRAALSGFIQKYRAPH